MAPKFLQALAVLLATGSSSQFALAAPTGASTAAAPTALLGYNPSNVVVNADTDDIEYTLVPGQTDSAVVGAYLDFNNVENPQPVSLQVRELFLKVLQRTRLCSNLQFTELTLSLPRSVEAKVEPIQGLKPRNTPN